MRLLIPAVLGLALAGCASLPSSVQPLAASAGLYDNLSCPQIAIEAQRLGAAVQAAESAQQSKVVTDTITVAIPLVIFWPAAILAVPFTGNDHRAAELAKVRGEMIALEQMSDRKRCGIQFRTAPSDAPAPAGLTIN